MLIIMMVMMMMMMMLIKVKHHDNITGAIFMITLNFMFQQSLCLSSMKLHF